MIVVEERLTEVFDQLPNIQVTTDPVFAGFKPVYKWGNEFHLIQVLKRFADAGESPYPLIYQTSSKSTQIIQADECLTRLRLVLACRNTDTSLLNENRWAMSYKEILFPLANYIEQALTLSGIIIWDKEYDLTEFPNYGDGEENKTTDIWDALIFECDIRMLGEQYCVQTINFN